LVNRWKEFNKKTEDDYKKQYQKMRIILYGSYSPPSELTFLKKLKKILVDEGYVQTRIALEYQEMVKGKSALEVSKGCIIYSDVNFFVITNNGEKLGVTRELGFLADDHNARNKIDYSTIFDEINDGQSTLSQLSLDDVDELGFKKRDFIGLNSLKAALLAEARFYVRKLKFVLESRVDV